MIELRNIEKFYEAGVSKSYVLRRISLVRFTDSDAINYVAASSSGLKLVEVAPNMHHVVGGSHNSPQSAEYYEKLDAFLKSLPPVGSQ